MAQDQQYGGFWVRLVALTLDNAIVFIILLAAVLGMAAVVATVGMEGMVGWVANLAVIFVPFLYWPVLESSRWQATVGKRIMGLQVTDLDGDRLSFVHALLRAFAKIVSSIPFGLGFLIAAFTARKQALHDLIVKTLVVRTGPSHLWKIVLALIVGLVLMVASAAGLFYFVVLPMFKSGFGDLMKVEVKDAPQAKTIPAPTAKTPPAAPVAAPAPVPAPVPAATPAPVPAPTVVAAVKPEPKPKAEPKAEPVPAPVVAAPAKPAAAAAKPEPKPRAEPKAQPAPAPAPAAMAAAERSGKPGPKFNDVMTAVLYRDAAGVSELLDMGRWVDKRDSGGLTPLMVAVRLRDAQMTQLLIRRGADVNASAAGGASPLAYARENRDAAMMELLQKSGAR